VTTVRVASVRAAQYDELLQAAGVEVAFKEAAVLLADPQFITAENLDGVKWVQCTWAGVEEADWNVIPASVPVTNLPGIFGPQIAEFVFGYLLARSQRIPDRFATRVWDETLPAVLRGTTIGVMGAGSIGASIAKVARVFGMNVVGCTRSGSPHPAFDQMFAVSDRATFATGLDHMVGVLPATAETRGLIDGALLDRMTRGGSFVNVGRGSTAVTDDVVAATRSGQLGLAVLDVTDPEPLDEDHPAWITPNLVVTGHTAAHSRPVDVVGFFVENLRRFEQGDDLLGVVDRSKGY
jgi:phosphoglycerate dehydrogenase-like enzyme